MLYLARRQNENLGIAMVCFALAAFMLVFVNTLSMPDTGPMAAAASHSRLRQDVGLSREELTALGALGAIAPASR